MEKLGDLSAKATPSPIRNYLEQGTIDKISHLYSFRYVSGVLMDGSKVGVSISKGGVNLDGTSVALEGTLNVLHFLECVAHVTANKTR